jgi:hypothetical protein
MPSRPDFVLLLQEMGEKPLAKLLHFLVLPFFLHTFHLFLFLFLNEMKEIVKEITPGLRSLSQLLERSRQQLHRREGGGGCK